MSITLRSAGTALSNNEVDSNFKTVMPRYGTYASANTLTLTDEYNRFNITGTTTINGIADRGAVDSAYGDTVILYFSGTLQLTHSANFFLPNATNNITTAAGDTAIFMQTAATPTWICVGYTRADGTYLAQSTDVAVAGDLSVAGHAHFGTKETITSAASFTIDWTAGNKQYVALNHDTDAGTITMTDPDGAASLILQITEVGAGKMTDGSTTWASSGGGAIYWYGGTSPTITVGSSTKDVVSFYFDGVDYYGSVLDGFVV